MRDVRELARAETDEAVLDLVTSPARVGPTEKPADVDLLHSLGDAQRPDARAEASSIGPAAQVAHE